MIFQRLLALLPPNPRHPLYGSVFFLLCLETGKLELETEGVAAANDTILDIDEISKAALTTAGAFNKAYLEKEKEDGHSKSKG